MTMIARLIRGGVPIYLADMLVSRKGTGADDVDIPAVANINAKLPDGVGRSVVGLRQKLNIISDKLIIAWAGDMLQARMLIREIAKAVKGGISKWEELRSVLKQIPESDRNDVALIGSILTLDNGRSVYLQHFDYCTERKEFDGVELVTAGTGADDLMQFAPQITASLPAISGTEDFLWATKLGLALLAPLVGHETITGANILAWWGGAFEIASIANGRFEKASNILHTIWRAIRVDDRKYEIRLVPKFIKYDYFEDVLIAQTLDVSIRQNQKNVTAHVNEHAYRLYTPLLKSRQDYDFSKLNPPDFGHRTLCCFILMEPELPSIGNHVRIYHSDTGDTPFRVIASERDDTGEERIRISFQDRLKFDLENAISSATGMTTEFNQIGS